MLLSSSSIEAKIEALQAEYARLRAEVAKPDGYTMANDSPGNDLPG
jgi:uncharacterized small protein (DUF1192 family)